MQKLKDEATAVPIISDIEVFSDNNWVYGVKLTYTDGSEFEHLNGESSDWL